MRINPNFELHDVCGVQVIVAEGKENIDFSKIISLNETAAYLWRKAVGHDFTLEELTDALCEAYEVTPEQASSDVADIVNRWQTEGLLQE